MTTNEIQTRLIEAAIRAPSADNRHALRFAFEADALRLHYAGPALSPDGGYKRVLVLLSIGAVLENIMLAATGFGLRAMPDVDAAEMASTSSIRIGLEADETCTSDPLQAEISGRHTNRQVWYRGPAAGVREREMFASTIGFQSEVSLNWPERGEAREAVLRLMRLAETERFRNRLLHQELFSAIRFDVGWRRSCAEGLPPGALGVEPPLRPFFSLLRYWPVMRLAKLLGAHHLLGWRACSLPCRLAPDLGILTVKNTDISRVVMAGRVFQRFWLVATRQGRVLQPMPASALYALPGAEAEGIPEKLRKTLADGWSSCLPGEIPLMIFRMGYAAGSAITTGRPDVEHFR